MNKNNNFELETCTHELTISDSKNNFYFEQLINFFCNATAGKVSNTSVSLQKEKKYFAKT